MLASGEPWAASVQWEGVNGADWLLRDVATSAPAALAEDPAHILEGTLPGVVQGSVMRNGNLAVVVVHDRFPEFWAQPSVWNSFLRGFSAYAGMDRDVAPEHWVGRSATDRRAWAFDPGRRSRIIEAGGGRSQSGTIGYEHRDGRLSLAWPGNPGCLYALEASDTLSGPFQTIEMLGAVDLGNVSVTLATPPEGQRYYRVRELRY